MQTIFRRFVRAFEFSILKVMQSFDAEKRRDQARSFVKMSFRAGCVSDGFLSEPDALATVIINRHKKNLKT